MRQEKKKKYQKHVAFSISGGCYFYQMGVAYFMQKHFDTSDVKFSGASGGSWPAALLAAGVDIREALEVVLEFAPQCVENRAWPILGAYGVYDDGIRIAFKEICKREPNFLKNVSGRLAISVTRLAWGDSGVAGLCGPYFKDEVVDAFTSDDDVVECIIASALIPFALNGQPFVRYRDWLCADGGITNVSGVRRFAAELVHDFERMEVGLEEMVEERLEQAQEMMEEGLEQAQRLSQSFPPLRLQSPSLQNNSVSSTGEEHVDDTHALHASAPISTGPYGVAYLPVNIATKVSAGLLHACSSVVSAGVSSVTSKFQYASSTTQAIISPALNCVSDFGGTTCEKSRERAMFDSTTEDSLEKGGGGESQYSSWSVPGLDDEAVKINSVYPPIAQDISNSIEPWTNEECKDIDNAENNSLDSTSVISPENSEEESSVNSLSSPSLSPKPSSSPSKRRSEDGVIRGDSTYWKVKSPLISKIPGGGGLQLEISPWSWRHQPVLNYHLSSDPETCRRLFEMGMVDAAEHHFDLMKFFSPEEFVLLSK